MKEKVCVKIFCCWLEILVVVFYIVSLKVFPKQNTVWSVVEISNKIKNFIISTLTMTTGRFLPRFIAAKNSKYYNLRSMKNAYIFIFLNELLYTKNVRGLVA
jgi:hypothetical protein